MIKMGKLIEAAIVSVIFLISFVVIIYLLICNYYFNYTVNLSTIAITLALVLALWDYMIYLKGAFEDDNRQEETNSKFVKLERENSEIKSQLDELKQQNENLLNVIKENSNICKDVLVKFDKFENEMPGLKE